MLNASAKSFSRKPLTSINLNKLTASESSSNLPEPEPHIQEERKSLKRSESDQNIAPGQIIRSQCLKNAEMQIQDSSIESQNSKKHALVNIRGQEEGIEDKIKARKSLRRNTLTHKSENTEKHENPFKHSEKFDKLDADKSAGRDRYQDGLVELMEKYLIEKMESVSVIRKKYQSQMEEILEMGNSPIIIEIVKQMEVSMNQEIQEFCAELEHKKLEEIARIRQVYIQ